MQDMRVDNKNLPCYQLLSSLNHRSALLRHVQTMNDLILFQANLVTSSICAVGDSSVLQQSSTSSLTAITTVETEQDGTGVSTTTDITETTDVSALNTNPCWPDPPGILVFSTAAERHEKQ